MEELQHHVERDAEDFNIVTIAGLKSYVAFVEKTLAGIEATTTDAHVARAAFADIQAKVYSLIQHIEHGGEVTDEDAVMLEHLYYHMIGEDPEDESDLHSAEEVETVSTLEERARVLHEEAVRLVEKHRSAVNQYPDTSMNAAAIMFGELEACVARAATLRSSIETTALIHGDQDAYEEKLERVATDLDALDEGLEDLFREYEVRVRPAVGSLAVDVADSFESIPITTPTVVEHTQEPIETSALPLQTPTVTDLAAARARREAIRKKSEVSEYIEHVARDVRQRAFLEETFGEDFSNFEASLMRQIRQVEAVDTFERTFRIEYASAFSFLRDMTIADIDVFEQKNNREHSIRDILKEKNIKYEHYLEWLKVLSAMRAAIAVHPSMKFGELFVRFEISNMQQHSMHDRM